MVKLAAVLAISLLSQICIFPSLAQTGGSVVRSSSKVDSKLVSDLEKNSTAPLPGIKYTNTDVEKDKRLDLIWSVQKPKFQEKFQKPFEDYFKIYFAQSELSAFLQDSFDRNKTSRIKDIAELYLWMLKDLTERDSMFIEPCFESKWEKCVLPKLKDQTGRIEKVRFWPWDPNHENKSYQIRENLIASSQFVYPITVILHYSAMHDLERNSEYGPFFKDFREKYFPVVYHHHLLRWVLQRGFQKGNFTQLGNWGTNCAPEDRSSYSHFDYVRGLIEKKFKCKSYSNAMQDLDGWIAFSTGHLLAAHALKPDLFPMENEDEQKLFLHLENFITLLHSRMMFETVKIPNRENVELVTIDKGGMLGWKDYDYAGYSGSEFPGQKWSCKNAAECNLHEKDKIPITKVGSPMPVPSPVSLSWDLGHARRFVNFFWSMKSLEKFRISKISTLKEAEKFLAASAQIGLTSSYSKVFGSCPLDQADVSYIDCRKKSFESNFTKAATAYANQLLYRVTIRGKEYSDQDFDWKSIHFSNYLCGRNGWYRVDYGDRRYFGYGPSQLSLELALLTGGQAFFTGYNKELQKPLKSLYYRSLMNVDVSINSVSELLTVSSFPSDLILPQMQGK